MKTILFLLLFAPGFLLAQTYNVSAQGGTVESKGALGPTLSGSSTIFAVEINGGPIEHESGTISFSTGGRSGSLQLGATFRAGGTLVITTANEGQIFSGTFLSGATWKPAVLANGTHYYVFSGSAVDADGNSGSLTFSTTVDPSVTCFYSGQESIATAAGAAEIE